MKLIAKQFAHFEAEQEAVANLTLHHSYKLTRKAWLRRASF
jgi:hypothetical protein